MVTIRSYQTFIHFILLPLLLLLGLGSAGYFYWNTLPPFDKQPINTPNFEKWLQQKQHQQIVDAYQRFLEANGVGDVMPMPELLANTYWQKCQVDPFITPPNNKWRNMIRTLQLLRELRNKNLLPTVAVISSYRYPKLNTCVGGSSKSKHLGNGALDMRLTNPTDEAHVVAGLCAYWQQYGAQSAMGLGLYARGIIHIDTQGFRTWGADYSAKSSPCKP